MEFLSGITRTNSYFLINSTSLAVAKPSTIDYDLQESFLISNSKSILVKKRKSISSTISILVLANRKISLKNQIFAWISWGEKPTVVIIYVWRYIPSIFCTPMLVHLSTSSSFVAKPRVIILTLLAKLTKLSTDSN